MSNYQKQQEDYIMQIVSQTLKEILDEKDSKTQDKKLESLYKFIDYYCTSEQKKEIEKQISSHKTNKLIAMVESGLLFKSKRKK